MNFIGSVSHFSPLFAVPASQFMDEHFSELHPSAQRAEGVLLTLHKVTAQLCPGMAASIDDVDGVLSTKTGMKSDRYGCEHAYQMLRLGAISFICIVKITTRLLLVS